MSAPPDVEGGESQSLERALLALDAVSPDHGIGRPDWRDTKIFTEITSSLDAARKIVTHPITLSATTLGIGIGLAHGIRIDSPHLMNTIAQVNAYISAIPKGAEVLEALQTWAVGPHLINTWSTSLDDLPLLNVVRVAASHFTIGGEAGLIGSGVFQGFLRNRRKIRIQEGTESLTKKESPRYLLVGPMDFMDSIASKALPRREKLHNPLRTRQLDVLIHTDPGTPSTLGHQIERHFDLSDRDERSLSSWFSSSENIKATGINRAHQGVFAAISADKALHYGRNASFTFTDSVLTTLVSSLGKADKDEKRRFLAIVPKGSTYLGGAVSGKYLLGATHPSELTHRLPYLDELQVNGNTIDVITPEDIFFYKHVQKSIQKSPHEDVNIILHGGSDTEMLKNFKHDLENRSTEDTGGKKIHVTIVSDTSIGDINHDEMLITSDANKAKAIQALYATSDLVYIYGDSDIQTTTLAASAFMLGVDVNKATYILEREGAAVIDKTANPLNHICVYTDLVGVASQWINLNKN